jgi:excisionase family DNA binding protein
MIGIISSLSLSISSHLLDKMRGIMEERWLSVKEVAEYLGVGRSTIYKWIERNNLPAHKAGRLWKFSKPEVDGWLRNEHATPRTIASANKNHT